MGDNNNNEFETLTPQEALCELVRRQRPYEGSFPTRRSNAFEGSVKGTTSATLWKTMIYGKSFYVTDLVVWSDTSSEVRLRAVYSEGSATKGYAFIPEGGGTLSFHFQTPLQFGPSAHLEVKVFSGIDKCGAFCLGYIE